MIATSLLLSVLLASAVSQPCIPDRDGLVRLAASQAFIGRAEKEWAASIATSEATFLERYAAPEFVAVFDGEVLRRSTLIASARRRKPGTASVALGTLRVHVTGSLAIAEGSEVWSSFGERRHIIWSDLWIRCGGKWRLLTSTSAGSPAPAAKLPRG